MLLAGRTECHHSGGLSPKLTCDPDILKRLYFGLSSKLRLTIALQHMRKLSLRLIQSFHAYLLLNPCLLNSLKTPFLPRNLSSCHCHTLACPVAQGLRNCLDRSANVTIQVLSLDPCLTQQSSQNRCSMQEGTSEVTGIQHQNHVLCPRLL